MKVYVSNQTEALAEALATIIEDRPLSDPFLPEVVATAPGLGQWLEMRLADRLGVFANARVTTARGLVGIVCDAALGAASDAPSPFLPETSMWALATLLRERAVGGGVFAPVRAYLEGDEGAERLVSLAARVANTFDHYSFYRPDLLTDWQRGALRGLGDDEAWQAPLWRALVEALASDVAAPPHESLLRALDVLGSALTDVPLPERAALFAPTTLPPAWLDLFVAAGERMALHLFHLTPTRPPPAARDPGGQGDTPLELGHPLVDSMGLVARDLHELLEDRALLAHAEQRFVTPAAPGLLGRLQQSVLERSPLHVDGLAAEDRSLTVHAAHGPLRELEILHDHLLATFAEVPALSPRDVVVLLPDVEAYAPFVPAVFSREGSAIPFRLGDRSLRASHEGVDAFLALLDLVGGRLSLPEVLDLLARAPVHERFGLREEELDRARRWLEEAGVRWGADAAHRAAVGQPAVDDNTWRFGLSRLLLGYMTPGDGASLFHDVVPYDDVEGGDADLLGRLLDFVDLVFEARARLGGRATVAAWCDRLTAVLRDLFGGDAPDPVQTEPIARVVEELRSAAVAMRFDDEVTFRVVREQLGRGFEGADPRRPLLGGGVTFCSLSSLRAVPARVVCLLGLDDGVFPRSRRDLSFDLMPRERRRGDRNPRDDDRDAFLLALLSARDGVFLSYRGRDQQTNEELPPSVVLAELLGFLDQGLRAVDEAGRPAVLQQHPLHAFDARYFDGSPGWFSYNDEACRAAANARALRKAPRALLPRPLPRAVAAPADPAPLALADLAAMLQHPCRWFAQRVLRLALPDTAEAASEREPIELNGLERWGVGDELMRAYQQGKDHEEVRRALRRSGRLPLGSLGDALLRELEATAVALVEQRAALGLGERLPPAPIDVVVGGRRLLGTAHDLWALADPAGAPVLVQATYSKLRLPKLLRPWITLLAMNASLDKGQPAIRGLVVGCDADEEKKSVPTTVELVCGDARTRLADLVALYEEGLRRPLPLFPKASPEFVRELGNGVDAAARAAGGKYRSSFRSTGDEEDPFVRLFYEGRDPLEEDLYGGEGEPPLDFPSVATRVYLPLYRQEAKG